MPFDPHDALRISEWLRDNTPAGVSLDTAQRTAIGRAYYAAYRFTIARASEDGFKPKKKAEDHGDLIRYLRSHRRGKVADLLETMRQNRNHVDYDDDVIDLAITLAQSIKDAKYIIQAMTPAAKPEPPKPAASPQPPQP